MKKSFILSIIGLIIALGIIPAFYYADHDLSDEDIVSIIKPEIISYCDYLGEIANSSTCATCRLVALQTDYLRVNEVSGSYSLEYVVSELPDRFNVEAYIPAIYGQNNRPGGEILVSFEIDKKGNLISKEMPDLKCI